MTVGILQNFIRWKMSRILFENDDLKLVESVNSFVLIADNLTPLFEDGKITHIVVKKNKGV